MSRNRDTFSEINITPLTDIFLVLLIIMMVIAPLLDQQGLNLTVPEMVEQNQVNKESKTIVVSVTNQDKYFLHGEEVPAENLGAVIKDQIKENPDGLMIESAPDATHGAVVKLMDQARNAGVTSISLSEG